MTQLDYFNRLPAREEHLASLRRQLNKGSKMSLRLLINKTGLTKTQTLCALQALLRNGEVTFELVDQAKLFYQCNRADSSSE